MLYTYNTQNQNVSADGLLTFQNNGVSAGTSATHSAGSSTVYLNRTGYYLINFNADVVENGAAGNCSVQLLNNGEAVQGAEATFYSGATTDIGNVSFNAVVKVYPNCCVVPDNLPLPLTVQNSGVAATFSNAALTVTKIG